MVKTEAFPTIRMKIDRLLKITNEYQFNDLVKAVYCINLCINNRSVLESCLALNACLIEYEEKGSKRIGTYDEFKGFFGKIYDVMKPGIADDYTVEDFGEVQLRYNDKFYRVIIGTGHNNVYACLNFLPTLARNISREEELCLALEYVSGTIDYFIEENKNDGVVEKRFVLPTEILFYKVQKFFKEEVKKYDILELDSLMMSEGTTIEKSHFVCREDNIYPLYNVSLLIDLYDIWENKIDFKEQISVANEGIIDRIYSLFEMDRSRSCSIFAPAMIFPEQKYDSSQRTYTFIAKASRGVVVALNADEYEEGQLEKHDDRNTLYLIETNLYLHCESETLATIDDINLLLAYANWLVVLNDVADMCHFADNEAYIEITDEYVVDTLADDQDAEALSGLHHRIYSYSGGLKRDHETDFKYLEKVKETFKEDMGFDLTDFLDILSYFSNSFSETIVKKIGNNVFRAPMKELLRDFLEQMNNVITEEDAATLFNYLVVSSQNLKTENGKINFYLPIGKRRTRDTRFELMPLVSINGDIIFSPITMDRLKKDWLNGIMDFILPYEVRMNKTKQLIVEWKKSYEKQIVYDIANSFKKNKFDIIKQNFELMKLNKSHPQWLGDYDVFAVDINNKSIWIVECKVIEKVATFYDMYRQQNRFFNEHKEDEKFQRRIDYLRENADQVIQQLGCTDYIGYKVIPYMCMNKVLVSRYKKVTFPIVSYPELVEIISGATRE